MIFIVSRQVIELAKLPPPVYSGDDSDAPGMRWVGRDDPFLTIQERRYPNVWRTSLYLPLTIIHPQPCTWLVVETCSNKFMNTTLDPRAFEEAWSSSHAPPVVELAKPLSVVGLFVVDIWYANSHLWSPLDTMLEETVILSYPGMLQRFRSPFIHHLTTISPFFFIFLLRCHPWIMSVPSLTLLTTIAVNLHPSDISRLALRECMYVIDFLFCRLYGYKQSSLTCFRLGKV